MPIAIYSPSDNEEPNQNIALLSDGEWELPAQIEELEKWLTENHAKIPTGDYIANLGYSPREGASGGGAILNIDTMKIMVNLGMNLYLSEYSDA